MDVGFLLTSCDTGGAQTMVLRYLERSDRTPPVFRLGGSADLEPAFRAAGADVVNLDVGSVVSPTALARARSTFEEYDLRVLHAHLPSAMIVARLAGRAAGIDHVVSTHHNVTAAKSYRPSLRALERLTRPLDTVQIAVSDAVRESQASVLDRSDWTTIHNGIDVAAFNDEITTADPPADLDVDGPVVLNVGRYVPQKGQRHLIDAMATLSPRVPDATAVVVGHGPLQADLEARVAERDLGDHVRVTGKVPEIAGYYAAADVFVMPSLWEGLPIVALEAMAAGLPIVGTRVPGVAEAITEDIGRIVPPRDPDRLAAGIAEVLEGDTAAYGDRALERARTTFDIEANVAAHERLYAEIVGEEAPATPSEPVSAP